MAAFYCLILLTPRNWDTVKTRIQEHRFSGFRLIGFLYIGYFRWNQPESVLNFLLRKKCKGFTNYDEILYIIYIHIACFCVFSLSLPCLLKIKDVTDTLTNGDVILLHIYHVIIRLLIPNTVVVHLLYTASEITSIYTEILVQYHSKATDTVLLNWKGKSFYI